MCRAFLVSFLVAPAAASVPMTLGASQTLEALKAQGVRDPVAEPRSEDAARKAGAGMDGNPFHIRAVEPVGYVPLDAVRRVEPPGPVVERPAAPRLPAAPAAPAPEAPPGRSPANRYYFEGKSPVQGLTLYTAKPDLTGDGRTGADGPDSPYGKYGTYALIGGASLAAGAFLLGGPVGIGLGILAGIALGAGALIKFLTREK